jgi:hypothetical protein
MSESSPLNPYSSPSALDTSTLDVTGENASTFWYERKAKYDNRTLCTLLCILFVLGAVLAVASVVSSLMQIDLLSQPTISSEAAESNDLREQMIAIVSLAEYILTAIVFAFFIIRAHHNVRGFGARGMTITPGWSFGYFFIPIFNLFRPYIAMSELYRASHSPERWNSQPVGVLPLWWTLWLVCGFLGQISMRLQLAADTIPMIIGATWVSVIEESLSILLCIVALLMISRIQKAQTAWIAGS